MTLYLIGIGLSSEKDITVKGFETIKKCDFVYLESYTSILQCSIKDLERFYNKKIIPADRKQIEINTKEILDNAKKYDTALLIIGDPLCATTHISIILKAKQQNIPVKIINNASIVSAIGMTGLEVYKFGKITSIPFNNENIKTPFEVFKNNYKNNLHTLFLLDLDPINKKFMTIKQALEYLIKQGLSKDQLCIGCARIGSENPTIITGKTEEISNQDFGKPPYCLVIPAKNLHFIEKDAINTF